MRAKDRKKRVCKISVIINVDDSDDDNYDNNAPLLAMVIIKATKKIIHIFSLPSYLSFYCEYFFSTSS